MWFIAILACYMIVSYFKHNLSLAFINKTRVVFIEFFLIRRHILVITIIVYTISMGEVNSAINRAIHKISHSFIFSSMYLN